jgi:hypothetical protein
MIVDAYSSYRNYYSLFCYRGRRERTWRGLGNLLQGRGSLEPTHMANIVWNVFWLVLHVSQWRTFVERSMRRECFLGCRIPEARQSGPQARGRGGAAHYYFPGTLLPRNTASQGHCFPGTPLARNTARKHWRLETLALDTAWVPTTEYDT